MKFKRMLAMVLSLVMISLSSTVSYANEDSANQYPEGVTPELIAYEARLLDYIEKNIDVLHEQIEDYKNSQANNIQPQGVSYGGFQYLDGDILVTKNTSSWGLTGHVGIIVGDKVLETTSKYNNSLPAAISMSTWFARYPQTMVMRYTVNRTIPVNAAWYGKTFYVDGEGKDNEYSVASSIDSLTKDYCSSLVWKCYHYGANFDYQIFDAELMMWRDPIIMLPYDFIVDSFAEYNNFTAVHSVDW